LAKANSASIIIYFFKVMSANLPPSTPNFQGLADICHQHDVAKLSLFGSTARGEAIEHSDVDLLVQFSKKKSLLTLVELEQTLSTAIGRKVDLVTESSLSPHLRDNILHDAQILYEAN
jgi:uncharacterized protein